MVLPVVLVHAGTADPPDDPDLLLTGGPCQSGIDAFTQSGAGLPGRGCRDGRSSLPSSAT